VVTATNSGGSANATSNQIAQVLDADLNAYMTAAAITSSTIIAAENNFFIARKNISSLSNVLASHHLVTDKATNADRLGQFKFNAYSPVDANVNKRLTYTGTVTANTTGMQGSLNGFANTFINPSTDFTGTDMTLAFVIRTNSSGTFCDFSALSGGGLQSVLSLGGITYVAALGADGSRGTGVVPNTQGIFILKRTGSSVTLYRNNVLATSWTDATTNKPNLNLYYMARNSSGAAGLYSTREYSFFEVINAALTTQQETDLYNAILTRETALGR
jgi:hypothetical protein